MTMQTYNLMTLSAQEMIRFFDVVTDAQSRNNTIKYSYDLSDKLVRNTIVQSTDMYDECALTFQINDELGGIGDLSRVLLYVDFNNIFSAKGQQKKSNEVVEKTNYKKDELYSLSVDKKVRIMFSDGISIKFEDGSVATFVPFDKSASMARDCRITFIDSSLKEKLDKRLMLDVEFGDVQTNLSKLYAYRGLYLTAARRLELDPEFRMDSETVIVIPDRNTTVRNQIILSAKNSDSDERTWELKDPEIADMDINAFDGEGFISVDYARLINQQLMNRYGFTKSASSFQIRMPFAKGVLHAVDFHSFAEEFTLPGNNDMQVVDVFGRSRSLKKAHVILTESMFKCVKWLGACIDPTQDPMEYYFKKFSHYKHSFYVGNTDVNLSNNTGRIKLNYQFLNTLDISGADFDKLMEQQKKAFAIAKNNSFRLGSISESSLDEIDTEVMLAPSTPAWALALERNRMFLKDGKITGMLNGIEAGMIKDCGLGRIDVEGECRFISRDLLAMLIHLVENGDCFDKAKVKEAKRSCLHFNRFYMPCPVVKLDPTRKYGILRNPHLSRNEQTCLAPYIPNKREYYYTRYLSHLNGLIMVAYKSLVPMALSGCDFDGDLVKIVCEPIINEAILRSVYSQDGDNRQLPIVVIPDSGKGINTNKNVPNSVDYETVKDTFANQVGYISNLAIKFGKKEYAQGLDGDKYAGKCAECTIVTGLEIDAAKTGRHPNLDPLESLDDHQKDYFLKTKDLIAGISHKRGFVFESVNGSTGPETLIYYKRANRPYLRIREYDSSDAIPNIDRLPHWFARYLQTKQERAIADKKTNTAHHYYFTFQTDTHWRNQLAENKRKALSEVICAYKKILSLSSRVHKIREKYKDTKYAACIYNLLTIKYDRMESQLLPGVTVKEALEHAYEFLDTVITSSAKANEVLKEVVNGQWQYKEFSERKPYLSEILGISESLFSEDVTELLTNFNCSGYKILYYVLKDVICQNSDDFVSNLLDEQALATEAQINAELYNQMFLVYSAAVAKKESRKIWDRKVIRLCREAVKDIFDDDFDMALRYAYSLRSSIDDSGVFFWSVFNKEEILRNVFIPSSKVGAEKC